MKSPYETPQSELMPLENGMSAARAILVYWEKKRILFNVVLIVVGSLLVLFTSIGSHYGLRVIVKESIVYGLFANLFYSLGPYANVLGVVVFNMKQKIWWPLFYVGLIGSVLLTVLIAAALLFGIEIPDQQ